MLQAEPLLEERRSMGVQRKMKMTCCRGCSACSWPCRLALAAVCSLVSGLILAVLLRLGDSRCGYDLPELTPVKGGLPEVWWTSLDWVGLRNLALLVGWVPGYSQTYFAAEPQNGAEGPRIALTIDDAVGDNATGAVSLLNLLEELEVNATFFVIADDNTARDESRQDILRRMAAAGHELGNHGLRDQAMTSYSHSVMEGEVKEWERRVTAAVPGWPTKGRKWFRPPKGLMVPTMKAVLDEEEYSVALGDVYSDDWLFEDPAFHASVLTNVATDGSVIILHIPDRPSRLQTLDILREAIPALRARGLRFVTLTELFETSRSSWRSLFSAPVCSVCIPCMAAVGWAVVTLLVLPLFLAARAAVRLVVWLRVRLSPWRRLRDVKTPQGAGDCDARSPGFRDCDAQSPGFRELQSFSTSASSLEL